MQGLSEKDRVHLTVQQAYALYQRHGKTLLSDPAVVEGLEAYCQSLEQTRQAMKDTRVVSACTICAGRTGSCCSREVEEWYDPVLLLINLLLGAKLPGFREIPDQCLFLGKNGCTLLARYAFCLNYLCPDLKKEIGPRTARELLQIIGHELAMGWDLERALCRILWKKDP